jgi:hypothetical protein
VEGRKKREKKKKEGKKKEYDVRRTLNMLLSHVEQRVEILLSSDYGIFVRKDTKSFLLGDREASCYKISYLYLVFLGGFRLSPLST